MNPHTTALVLIEYQNEFAAPGGKLHDAVKPVMEQTGMLANTVALVNDVRPHGVSILLTPITFAPGHGELGDRHPFGILAAVRDGKTFEKGTWGAELVPELQPQPGDIVVEGKRGLDAFASTNLDFLLRSKGIETVALGGFLTNCCIESTMRTAYEKGFEVVTLTDCCATVSPEAHAGALQHDFPMFSRPMTAREFRTELLGTA